MIGSISKIRPCGHHHYYKYAHAKTATTDMKQICADYKNDLEEDGEFTFNLNNMQNFNSAFTSAPKIKKFRVQLPNQSALLRSSFQSSGLEELYLNTPKLTELDALCYLSKLNKLESPNMGKFKMMTNFAHTCSLKHLRYDFSSLENGQIAFYNNYGITKIESDLSKLQKGHLMFINCPIKEAKYPIDEDGVSIWVSGKEQHIIDGVPQFKYLTLPNLKEGNEMFNASQFDKPSILSILNSLPDWSNDTASHPFKIQGHIDSRYDDEVNIALKKVSKDYTAPLEYTSAGLSEEVTKDKGWTLTMGWSGACTKNAKMNQDLLPYLDLDTISLPQGYTRCMCLISDGSQIIKNTGIVPTANTGIWGIHSTFSDDDYCVCGVWQGNNGQFALARTRPSSTYMMYYGKNVSIAFKNSNDAAIWGRGIHAISSCDFLGEKKATLYMDELNQSVVDTTNLTQMIHGSNQVYLFGLHYYESYNKFAGAIYRIKISEGTEIVRDFIPCLDANGKPCMRDVINGVDYYNEGTGVDFDYEIYESE